MDPDQFLARYRTELRALLEEARRAVLNAGVDLEEKVLPGWGLLGYYHKGYVGFVMASGAEVRIGFERGATLPDPGGLLQGDHLKSVRYAAARSVDEVREKAAGITELLHAAVYVNITRGTARKGG